MASTERSAKITGLSHANVDALREAAEIEPGPTAGFNVTLGRTVAEFVGGESEALTASLAIRWLDRAMAQMPTRGHPRHSLHAVRRKLAALVPAHAPLRGPAHVIDSEGRTRDTYTGEEIEL